ncbi:MAG: hypothetical protein KDA70_03425 [Planctomycetaceae bacterium]|nr:hypothetical protein [Planctomycetaceae bacterium]MCA9020836.1 hypothetical protein [Planctomycetaceae bacterium]
MDTESPLPARKKRFPFMIVLTALALVTIYTLLVFKAHNLEYKKIKAVHQEFLVLQQQGASDTEWESFKQSVHTRIDPVIKKLEATASSEYPVQQQLLWAARDYLYPMLDSARVSRSSDQVRFEKHLREAESR